MTRLESHDRVLVLGKTGSGKSNKAKALISSEMKHGTRVLAFDPLDEWSQAGRKAEHVHLGPLAARCTIDELLLRPERLDAAELALAVVPSSRRRECAEDFGQLAELVRDTGDLLLVVEEVGFFGDCAEERLVEAACTYRHFGVSLMMVAQRAVQIPKTARVQASQIYSGRQDDPDDLSALAKIAGQDFAARVSRLPRGELLHWRDTFTQEK